MSNLVKVKALVPLAQVELPYSEGHTFEILEARAKELEEAGFVEILEEKPVENTGINQDENPVSSNMEPNDNPENIEVIDAEEVGSATKGKPKK